MDALYAPPRGYGATGLSKHTADKFKRQGVRGIATGQSIWASHQKFSVNLSGQVAVLFGVLT